MLLIDMNLSQSHCNELVEQTAAALDQKILQALFVSTQRNKLELCFQYSILYKYLSFFGRMVLNTNHREVVSTMLVAQTTVLKHITGDGVTSQDLIMLASWVARWFPRTVVRLNYILACNILRTI
jgi:hypothetical protein